MYSYNEINGKVFSSTVNLKLFKSLLNFSDKFWKKQKLNNDKKKLFQKQCKRFYYDKTLERINLFYKKFSKIDQSEKINGEKIPKLAGLLKKIDWKDILDGAPGQFHGDYHFENILFLPSYKKFIFLDWRQDFAGNLKVGDIYYDLAKLLHGLIVSHELIVKNKFKIKWNKHDIKYKLLQKKINKNCENYFYYWCSKKNYSIKKIKIITALIFLNIAALHHYPYSLFLYALGKHMLKKTIMK